MTSNSIAQEPYYFNIGQGELKGVDIYSILDNNNGNLLLSTNNGIYEYDGYTFSNTKTQKGNSNHLFGLIKDKQNNIYCYDLNRNIYTYTGDSLQLFYTLPDSLSLGYMSINFDSNDDLIIKKIDYYRLTPKKELSRLLKAKSSDSYKRYMNNDLLFFQHEERNVFSLKNGKLQLIAEEIEIPFENKSLHPIGVEKELYLVTPSFNKILKINNNEVTFIHDSSEDPTTNLDRFYQLSDSLFIVVKKKGESSIVNIKTGLKLNKQPLFKDYYISYSHIDANGGIWLGTLKRGLIFIPNLNSITFDNVLEHEFITAIEKNNQQDIFIGTLNGNVYKIDKHQNLTFLTKSINARDVLSIKNIPQHNHLLINASIFDYSGNRLSAFSIPISTKHTTKISENLYGIAGGKQYCLANILDKPIVNNQFGFIFKRANENSSTLSLSTENASYSFYDSTTNTLFIAGTTGLKKVTSGTITDLKFEGEHIQATGIVHLNEHLLVATINNGFLLLKGDVLQPYFTNNAFSEPIHAIKKDNKTIYFSSYDKIHFFNQKDKVINQIDLRDGLKPDKIIDFVLQNNQLWVISNQSVQSIDLDKLQQSPDILNCFLSKIHVNDSLIFSKKSFFYGQNNFGFTLTTNLTSDSKHIKYQYQLLGFDSNKKETKLNENIVQYNNLLPGNYTFKANTIAIDGSVSDEISYAFNISPPYWKTWWFISLMAIVALAIIIAVVFFRIRLIKKRLILENKVKASDIRTIKAQMNPHFIFNSLNSIQDLILQKDIRKSNHYLSVFADLMRSVLTVSGQDSITIEKEVEILSMYVSLEQLRFEDDLDVNINCQLDQKEKEDITIPSLLLQPYIENAFKHGLLHKKGIKKLDINFYIRNNHLICEIIDNGIGVKQAKKIIERRNKTYQSFSVYANQKRIDLINELNEQSQKIRFSIEDASDNEFYPGTKIVFTFPLSF